MSKEQQRVTEALAELADALEANRQLRAQVRRLEDERAGLETAFELQSDENLRLRQQIADLEMRAMPAVGVPEPLHPDDEVTE